MKQRNAVRLTGCVVGTLSAVFVIWAIVVSRGNPVPFLATPAAAQPARPAPQSLPAEVGTWLQEVVLELGPVHEVKGTFHEVCAARYTLGQKFIYAIRFPGNDSSYDLDPKTAEQVLTVFKKIANSERPKQTIVTSTVLSLEFTSIKGNRGKYEWKVQATDDGHRKDVDEAKAYVVALEAALKDVELLKKVEPAYKP